jgi:hypothetical protein
VGGTQAEMKALVTLVKNLIILINLCYELKMLLDLPAIVMEDNAAVMHYNDMEDNAAVMSWKTEECAIMKRCKHFLKDNNFVSFSASPSSFLRMIAKIALTEGSLLESKCLSCQRNAVRNLCKLLCVNCYLYILRI